MIKWVSDFYVWLCRTGFPAVPLHTANREYRYFLPCLDIWLIPTVQMLSANTLHYLTPPHWPIALLSAWPHQYHSPVPYPLHAWFCAHMYAHACSVPLLEAEFVASLYASQWPECVFWKIKWSFKVKDFWSHTEYFADLQANCVLVPRQNSHLLHKWNIYELNYFLVGKL